MSISKLFQTTQRWCFSPDLPLNIGRFNFIRFTLIVIVTKIVTKIIIVRTRVRSASCERSSTCPRSLPGLHRELSSLGLGQVVASQVPQLYCIQLGLQYPKNSKIWLWLLPQPSLGNALHWYKSIRIGNVQVSSPGSNWKNYQSRGWGPWLV